MKNKFRLSVGGLLGCTALVLNASGQTTINPDGFSTHNSLPLGSKSLAIGNNYAITSGPLLSGYLLGENGANLVAGHLNFANSSNFSIVGGLWNEVTSQEGSLAFGFENQLNASVNNEGYCNIVLGYDNKVNPVAGSGNQGSILIGFSNTTNETDSWVIGAGNIGQERTLTVGTYGQYAFDAAFIVGVGTSPTNRKNGLVVYRDGSTAFEGDLEMAANKGIYFGSNTSATVSANSSGAAVFPYGISAPNGLQLSNGNLQVTSTIPSTSSSTGAITVLGGIGVGKDSYINEVRVGRGGGEIPTNTTLGSLSLVSNTSGAYNVATGSHALRYNTTGSYNSAGGASALLMNTTGASNTANGAQALRSNSGGDYNSAFGVNALYSNTTGSLNSGIGLMALGNNSTGSSNAGNGAYSLQSNTTGSFNSAVGRDSLGSNTTGSYNASLGNEAGFRNTTGSSNVFVGWRAGSVQASGLTLLHPENSIYIGSLARGKNNDDSNSIVIGHAAIGQGANTAVIGNTSTVKTFLHGETRLSSNAGSAGSALVVDGETTLNGKVVIATPQGDISMGIYQ